ncbi:MoaD/ThiS family protein [Desulfovibrio psychrotolerans]|uniref:Molybdopterin synthase sulfur carrier subunit n=1 Tax=Desulfovibrio psychrotolerans TaxID=415242 RepID=A0A7J0BRZ4_9BACT|nr:MoaD/ThiS family protein [Desulfovibrio psychrotolerans]GFM35794.1 hypothetical protein DSM19430T_04780 [Desulfovibrio psychrotolerans]
MRIEIKCFATLAHYAPAEGVLDVEEGTRVEEVIALLQIPADEVKIRFINGVHVQPEAVLSSGDRLGLFPAVGGG